MYRRGGATCAPGAAPTAPAPLC